MDALKDKLTYANVVATLALIVAVAGIPTAVAVTKVKVKKNSITSKQIKNGAIRPADLAQGAVTNPKLADGGVTSAKLAPIRLARATEPGGGTATATCAPGERLLSGGGGSPNAFAGTSPSLIAGGWEVGGGAPTTAIALCLSSSPSG